MKGEPEAVMLFAAGFGTRMGNITKDKPKPMVEVAGRPLINHALDLAEGIGPSRIVANVHYLADQIIAYLAATDVRISLEEPDILETGGGLRAALPLLESDPVFTLNTDAIWAGPNPLRLLRKAWRPEEMDALLMCVPVAHAIGYSGQGDFSQDASGRIARGPGLIYGGAQIIKTSGLTAVPDSTFSLNVVWDQMHDAGRLHALQYPGRWCDVGRPEGIVLAEELIADV
ncbi:nucleotidyltransferase family protein [Ruegeria arenilitoris]|uniref:nucleotidyltransferase family protein n=1 Tax=Ruegeria arenilitoris TaxID=1173585 RepID=UPI00147A41DD|nr:nucleotidyltransferase family protein [Ruegeria arenilitoris]